MSGLTVKKRYELINEDKRQKLKNAQGLTKLEQITTKAALGQTIKILSESELMKKIKDSIELITLDIGIKKFTGEEAQYQSARFYQTLKRFYEDLTFEEVKNAFDLSMSGNLDQWLPKQNGLPDNNHYQSFSTKYIHKILKAYREYKNTVWTKVYSNQPDGVKQISENQKKENKKFLHQMIINSFDEYKLTKKKPSFILPSMILKELKKAGFYNSEIEITEDDKKNAMSFVMAGNFSILEKSKIKRDVEEGKENAKVFTQSRRESQVREICKIFDDLIECEIELKNIFGV